MRAPTEILGIRYFLLGVIFTRTDTRVESSHQGTPQNKNKSFSFHFQTARAFGVASAFGPDHYILPHITQRIQAASAFQAGPHFISYPGAVPTLSRLHHCLSSWQSTLGFLPSERILEESQMDTLVVRVTGVFSEVVSNYSLLMTHCSAHVPS